MNLKQELNLQLFADAGTLVNASGNYVNAYSGETSAFPDGGGMTASMKTFYDTELLENARPELIHTQFARKQALPAGRGKTVEWRKWNTLEDAGALTEGVIPTGQKFGQSAVTLLEATLGEDGFVNDIYSKDYALVNRVADRQRYEAIFAARHSVQPQERHYAQYRAVCLQPTSRYSEPNNWKACVLAPIQEAVTGTAPLDEAIQTAVTNWNRERVE